MNPIAVAVLVLAAFAAGVVFNKYVISEAEKIKRHVSEAETRIRGDISSLLSKGAAKVGG
jgi:hypothetical protein